MAVQYLKRLLVAFAGVFLCGAGVYLSVQANIGLGPWDAFSMGLSYLAGMSFGNMVVLVGIFVIGIDLVMKEKIGFGTLINTIFVGKTVNFLDSLNLVPPSENLLLSIFLMLAGLLVLSIGTWMYMVPGLGCGPRDSMMVGFGKRFPNKPIGLIRGIIEAVVLLAGFLMGAKVGLGTVIYVFGISFLLQGTFRLLHFESRAVQHEDVLDTLHNLLSFHKGNPASGTPQHPGHSSL